MKKKYLMLLLVLSGLPFSALLRAQDSINVDFTGVDSSLNGQNLTLYLRDPETGEFQDSVSMNPIDTSDFTLSFDNVDTGSYYLDFYSDVNGNGMYDVPPTDNSWRIVLDDFQGDTTLIWVYDTNYFDITWQSDTGGVDTTLLEIALNFTGMTPHVGQDLTVYVRHSDDGEIVDSLVVSPVDTADFGVVFDSVESGLDYNVDFWADMNTNGMYDSPPTDHAWRFELPGLSADTILNFAHNTDFTDIFADSDTTDTANYQITVNFTGFADNEGQNLTVYLRNPETDEFVDSVLVTPIDSGDFTVVFDSVTVNNVYNIDFYTDVNGNGSYDIPPVDHAWRIELNNVDLDTVIVFVFDTTTFTDIGLVTTAVDDIEDLGFSAYPNPVKDELNVQLNKAATDLSIYNVTGALVLHKALDATDRIVRLNVSSLKPGMYILKLKTSSGTGQYKFLKE
ncbi:MAG TPA: T9SS type A sorting domain-containing protein [Bacteroidales bacterium]|nr:T9SS type A sorting domain-containing protein [Bacteroidales bacterium]